MINWRAARIQVTGILIAMAVSVIPAAVITLILSFFVPHAWWVFAVIWAVLWALCMYAGDWFDKNMGAGS